MTSSWEKDKTFSDDDECSTSTLEDTPGEKERKKRQKILVKSMDPMCENKKPTTSQENEKTFSKDDECCRTLESRTCSASVERLRILVETIDPTFENNKPTTSREKEKTFSEYHAYEREEQSKLLERILAKTMDPRFDKKKLSNFLEELKTFINNDESCSTLERVLLDKLRLIVKSMDRLRDTKKPTTSWEKEKTFSEKDECSTSTLEDTSSEEQSEQIKSMLSETLDRIRKNNQDVMEWSFPDILKSHIDDEVGKLTLLHHATLRDNLWAVKYLVEHGAKVDSYASGFPGSTPLHLARSYEVAQFLVENEANIEAKNNSKLTPLISAYHSRSYKVMYYLLSKGADSEYLRDLLGADSDCSNMELIRKTQIEHRNFDIEHDDSDDEGDDEDDEDD